MRSIILVLTLILLSPALAGAQSLDIGARDCGLSLGNSPRFTGIRINAIDQQVLRIRGLNLTVWTPGENPRAQFQGLALAVIGTKARSIRGIALSGIGVNAREHLGGIAAGTLGVGAGSLTGIGAGAFLVDVEQRLRGIAVAGIWTGHSQRLDGLAISAGIASAKRINGIAIGGVFAGGDERFAGMGIGGLVVGGKRLQGIFAGGLFLGGEDLNGIACTPGGIGGRRLDGIMLSGLGLGAGEKIRGIAVGGAVVFAPEATGLTIGALNGLYIDRIDLEDFLHFDLVNRRFTGLSIGLLNYTANLKGVQIGLMNYAGNNPRWLRLLPVINVHM